MQNAVLEIFVNNVTCPVYRRNFNNPKKAYAVAGKAVRHWLAILNLVCTLLDEKIQANFKQCWADF